MFVLKVFRSQTYSVFPQVFQQFNKEQWDDKFSILDLLFSSAHGIFFPFRLLMSLWGSWFGGNYSFDVRGIKVGGKGSTAYLVKGSHKEVPQELIDELVAVCGVLCLTFDNCWDCLLPVGWGHSCLSCWFIVVLLVQENVTMEYEERFFHGKPQNSFHKAVNIPDVVVFPR